MPALPNGVRALGHVVLVPAQSEALLMFRTEFSAGTSNLGQVTLARRFRDGRVERETMHPFAAHLDLATDERRGREVIGMWIEPGSESDSGWTVSHVPWERPQ
ncbi:MAG TPA: hypothetical protein PLC98_17110 [Anaerolineales bacterium]|nr:hypothetical protein [Anaerolineales bacterium]